MIKYFLHNLLIIYFTIEYTLSTFIYVLIFFAFYQKYKLYPSKISTINQPTNVWMISFWKILQMKAHHQRPHINWCTLYLSTFLFSVKKNIYFMCGILSFGSFIFASYYYYTNVRFVLTSKSQLKVLSDILRIFYRLCTRWCHVQNMASIKKECHLWSIWELKVKRYFS